MEPPKKSPPRTASGWDGKLRLGQTKDEHKQDEHDDAGQSDSENEQEPEDLWNSEAIPKLEGEQIDADEDLLEGVPEDETEIDLNHARIETIPALRLERLPKLERLCLRQNRITHPKFPPTWGVHLTDLDLYDNNISHIRGLDDLKSLRSLDLSFNNIKHIKNIGHLTQLTDLYFVQNRIQKIEGLEGLSEITNLELAANRIREIENLDSLVKLEQLWLGKNKITELKNLSHLTNLTLLSIQSNRLTSPSLSHLSSTSFPHLTDLHISHNALTTLTPLSTLTSLHTLDISSNPLPSLDGLEPLKELEELWASDCELDSFEEMRQVLGDKEGLGTVYFEGNPLQRRGREVYRGKVRLALPRVRQIDATFVRVD